MWVGSLDVSLTTVYGCVLYLIDFDLPYSVGCGLTVLGLLGHMLG
jgi:hypothetical protein